MNRQRSIQYKVLEISIVVIFSLKSVLTEAYPNFAIAAQAVPLFSCLENEPTRLVRPVIVIGAFQR
jgi:hypothetical protein